MVLAIMAANPFVVDVTEENFTAEVLERSHTVPVLVDFWAEWCGPCKMLGPVLEQLAAQYGGKFILAKLDTEQSPRLGAQYRVQSIPAVKLFHQGEIVGEFVGALPGSQVERFLQTHIPSEAQALVQQAHEALATGDKATAREKLREALEDDDSLPAAHLGLAKLALDDGDAEIVGFHVGAIKASADEYEAAQHVKDALQLVLRAREYGGLEAAEAKMQADPHDLEARFALGCAQVAKGDYASALATFLESVKQDRKHDDAAARKAMLTVFGIIGRRTKLADQYVRQLQIYA